MESRKKSALITGAGGQDGHYLTDLLLSKNYFVIGIVRRSSTGNSWRLDKFKDNDNFLLLEGDVCDYSSILNIIDKYRPDKIFHLAAQSHVHTSFNQPNYTFDVTAKGTLNILECLRLLKGYNYHPRFYNAASSECFGKNYTASAGKKYQYELTPFSPCSPYAISKVAGFHLTKLYRESYGIFASNGILGNHESPYRGDNFVTKKITKWIGEFVKWQKDIESKESFIYDYNTITDGWISSLREESGWLFGPKFPKLKLGNLQSFRDWGFAGDYVQAMYMILDHDRPDDFVVGTGETHTVGEFLRTALNYANLTLPLENYVVINENLKRPSEVPYLCMNAQKIRLELGWKQKVNFQELVKMMVDWELNESR